MNLRNGKTNISFRAIIIVIGERMIEIEKEREMEKEMKKQRKDLKRRMQNGCRIQLKLIMLG